MSSRLVSDGYHGRTHKSGAGAHPCGLTLIIELMGKETMICSYKPKRMPYIAYLRLRLSKIQVNLASALALHANFVC